MLSASSERLQYLGSGAIQQYLSRENFESLKFSFPSVPEQLQIVQYIESETLRIDRISSMVKKEIALLQEYRTALISEIITGKIDIRETT